MCRLLQICLFSTNKPHMLKSARDKREAGFDEGSTIHLECLLFHLYFFNSFKSLVVWFHQWATSLHELWFPVEISTLDDVEQMDRPSYLNFQILKQFISTGERGIAEDSAKRAKGDQA